MQKMMRIGKRSKTIAKSLITHTVSTFSEDIMWFELHYVVWATF